MGAAAAALLTQPLAASAQAAFPARPVRLLLAFPAGGSMDLIARELAKGLSDIWGVPVVVDNKPGASGVISADALAKAPPDGHTLLLALYDTLVITPEVVEKMPYDTARDLVPVGLAALIPLVLVTATENPYKSVADVVAAAKAKPEAVSYATTGIGGGQHLAMELFQRLTGTKMNHVPYKGVAGGLQDVVAGRVSLMLASPSTAMGFLREGKLTPLAYAGLRRAPQLPAVPTFIELGYTNFEVTGWTGLMLPRGASPALVARINADLRQVVASKPYGDALLRQGNEPRASTPAEMAERIQREHAMYAPLIKQLNLKN